MAIPFLNTVEITHPSHLVNSLNGTGTDFGIYRHTGDPNNEVAGAVGSLCIATDGTLWQKVSGLPSETTVWAQLTTSIDTHLANEDKIASGNRNHDWNNFSLSIQNADSMSFQSTLQHVIQASELLVSNSNPNVAARIKLDQRFNSPGSESVSIAAPDDVETNWTLTLPQRPPQTGGYALIANTSGEADWGPVGGANITVGTLDPAQDNRNIPLSGRPLTFQNVLNFVAEVIQTTTFEGNSVEIKNTFDTTAGGQLRLYESIDDGTHFTGIRANAQQASTYTLTLPNAGPNTNGQVLQANLNGDLSWVTITPGTDHFRGSWADLTTLNLAADPTSPSPPFDTQPATDGDYAILLNSTDPATWAIYDPEAPNDAVFVEVSEGETPNTNLGIANRTTTTLDVTSSTGTPATVPPASTTQAGLLTAQLWNKLNDITVFEGNYGAPGQTIYDIDHFLETEDFVIKIHDNFGDSQLVYPEIQIVNSDRIRIIHGASPANTNQYHYSIQKIS